MSNQTKTARVETRRPEISEAALRRMLRPHGDTFALMLREIAESLGRQCNQRPEPRQLGYDVAPQRGRSATYETIGCAIAAAASDPTLPEGALERAAFRILGWLQALRPQTRHSLVELFDAESHAQADADPSQAMAILALQTRDRIGLERALDVTTAHMAQIHRLQGCLQAALNELDFTSGARRFA